MDVEKFTSFFLDINFDILAIIANYSEYLIAIPLVFLVSFITFKIGHAVIKRLLIPFLRTLNILDHQILEKTRLFIYLAYFFPLSVLYSSLQFFDTLFIFIERFILVAFVYICCRIFESGLDIYHNFLIKKQGSKRKAIKSYFQFAKIIIYMIGIIFGISFMLDRNPLIFISSLGAITAVLLLVFRTTIIGFITSVQINANNLIQVGDWIELPSYKIDGEVIEITLYIIKIKNWDNSISILPLENLQSNDFRNWQGMISSGGRRIKRSLIIDVSSIHFLDYESLLNLQHIDLIKNYIEEKISQYKTKHLETVASDYSLLNQNSITNIGTFRYYILEYIHQHPKIHNSMMYMIRQKQHTPEGLPIEIYAFSNDIDWVNYEKIQSDIFDHLLAATKYFGLKIYQKPSVIDHKLLYND